EDKVFESIKEKFYEKFGVPMFQEITNLKFSDGEADLIDYVIGQLKHNTKDSEMKPIYQELKNKKILVESKITYVSCVETDCPHKNHVIVEGNFISTDICPLCDGDLSFVEDKITNVEISNIKKEIKKKIEVWCQNSEWEIQRDSKLTYGGKIIELLKVARDESGEVLHLFIADETVDRKLLKKLHKQLIPLIVVFVGQQEKFIEKYSDECIQAITFGKLYTQHDKNIKIFFEDIYKNLE